MAMCTPAATAIGIAKSGHSRTSTVAASTAIAAGSRLSNCFTIGHCSWRRSSMPTRALGMTRGGAHPRWALSLLIRALLFNTAAPTQAKRGAECAWSLVWQDEFNQPGDGRASRIPINAGKWTREITSSKHHVHNNEFQAYTGALRLSHESHGAQGSGIRRTKKSSPGKQSADLPRGAQTAWITSGKMARDTCTFWHGARRPQSARTAATLPRLA